jgi:hypothetical protein
MRLSSTAIRGTYLRSVSGAATLLLLATVYVALCGPVFVADLKEMVGTWRWRHFTSTSNNAMKIVCARRSSMVRKMLGSTSSPPN